MPEEIKDGVGADAIDSKVQELSISREELQRHYGEFRRLEVEIEQANLALEQLINLIDAEISIGPTSMSRSGLIDLLSAGIEAQKRLRDYHGKQIGRLEAQISKLGD